MKRLRAEDMPVLRPVPIPTKSTHSVLLRLWLWYQGRQWELADEWCYHYQAVNGDHVCFIIPKGFHFDGASIPRWLRPLLSPVGLLLISGLIHDYAYRHDQLWSLDDQGNISAWHKGAGRDCWDDLFKAVGKEVNGLFLLDGMAAIALAIAGCAAWKENRRRNEPIVQPTGKHGCIGLSTNI